MKLILVANEGASLHVNGGYSDQACSESFWKNLLDFADALSRSSYQIPGDGNDNSDDFKPQQHPNYSGGRRRSPADQESIRLAALTACSDINMTYVEAPSLYQRLLSAIIKDDKREEMSFHSEGRNAFQCASEFHFEAKNREKVASNDNNCKAKGRHMDHEVLPQLRKQGVVDLISENYMGSSLESIAFPICNYLVLSVEDKLRLELQSIDLYPKMIAEEEDAIHNDIVELEAGIVQQVLKRKKCMRKTYKCIQHGKDAENRNLEHAALSERINMACKKQRVSCMSNSSKGVFCGVSKDSKQVALPSTERTLAKCRVPPVGSSAGIRESKLKPMVKASNLLASGSESGSRYIKPTDAASESPRASSVLDIVDGGMKDQDWLGLDIPMDDLADVPLLSLY